MYNYCVYNNLFWIFLIQLECPSAKHAQSYGRAGRVSCISWLLGFVWSNMIYISMFLFIWTVYFMLMRLALDKLSNFNTVEFRVKKMTISSTFLIRLRIHCYCFISDIAIFAFTLTVLLKFKLYFIIIGTHIGWNRRTTVRLNLWSLIFK